MGWNNPWFYTWNSSSSSLSDVQEQQAIRADKGLLPYQILSQNVCACGCVLVPNYMWLGEQVISYFRWLLLLCPIEQRGGRCWRSTELKEAERLVYLLLFVHLESRTVTALETSLCTRFILSVPGCSPRVNSGAVQSCRSCGQCLRSIAVSVLLNLSPSQEVCISLLDSHSPARTGTAV